MTLTNRVNLCMNLRRPVVLIAALAVAQFGLCVASVYAGETPQAVTISLSGSTAMRNFTTNANITALTPGNGMTLANGFTYAAAPAGGGVFPAVQLGANTNDTLPPSNPMTNANYRAFRVEWHEQGSVEGILELANDQIGTLNSVSLGNRNPTTGNPTWINGTIGGSLTSPGTNGGGFTLNTSSYDTYANYNAAGSNLQGGQNRVQMAISDVNGRQGFSTAGAAAYNRTPGQAGYGKGNAALALVGANDIVGLGAGGVRRQLNDQSVLNMSTDKINPATGTNYASGAWNTAGVENLRNTTVAITATTFSANPGTGLTKVNRTDAQFLQATGRLANGADFNVVTRDVNSGTLNVAALNVGIDPSFAVGENDNGNGNAADGGTTQTAIGSGIKFSQKTSGGSGLRPTVQNSRMAIGHLSISDARAAASGNGGTRPIRVLAYRDDANDLADGSNGAGFADPVAGFVKPSFDTITDGTYVLYQNQTYVTVKTPDADYSNDVIKGDYATSDVKQFRDNILNSAGTYPNNAGFLNPANGLIATGFIPGQYMKVRKDQDGLNQSVTNPTFDAANYETIRTQATGSFAVADASAITLGAGSTYGNVAAASGGIAVTANNYLFGDFDNDGDRDFADVKLAASAQDKLAQTAAGVTYATSAGSVNNQPVAGLTGALSAMTGYDGTAGAKRGDLIIKGDFDSNGKFDGKDLYLLAHGAALADSTTTDTLSVASGATFGDQIRKGVLRKNAALDYLKANATDAQRSAASVDGATSTADDGLAFDKLDVNRDGVLSRVDAQIVDKFVGKNVGSLDDQLAATIATDGTVNAALVQKSISLVDAELDDNLAITATLVSSASDFQVVRGGLGSLLTTGDADFDAIVGFQDLVVLAQNYNLSVDRWSKGDFNLDGTVDFADLVPLAQNYGTGSLDMVAAQGSFDADWALAQSLVPEPATGLVGLGLTFAATARARSRTRR
jgi:hypothetical protein